ncbi:MAG: lipoxygenase family protein, partial [Thermoanaerobaculia bacterium]
MGFFDTIHKLPLPRRFKNLPAVPVDLEGMAETLVRLGLRAQETKQATQGLTEPVTLGGVTAPAYEFLFGGAAADASTAQAREELRRVLGRSRRRAGKAVRKEALREDQLAPDALGRPRPGDGSSGTAAPGSGRDGDGGGLTSLPIERPEQWSLSWTTLPDVQGLGAPHRDAFAATLTDPETATAAFFPTIAEYGLAYNLVLPRKLGPDDLAEVRKVFGAEVAESAARAAEAGRLYGIDLRLFEALAPHRVRGAVRFTPSTYTLLRQDDDKNLLPFAVRVAGEGGARATVFRKDDATASAWLYALQAAKTSVTVWGIWLGHVYHWHVVTAALQMTLLDKVPEDHPVSRLLRPQSSYLIPFDDVLLVLWNEIAPPTSVTSGLQFLELANRFARDREFFDDDPKPTLRRLGIEEGDFTVDRPWDRYPLVGRLLEVWEACAAYVEAFVDATYATGQDVADDEALQEWILASGAKKGGNVRGLPPMTSRAALAEVLTSFVYRIVAHGTSRLYRAANPALTFVANFPPCLQETDVPEPTSTFDTQT